MKMGRLKLPNGQFIEIPFLSEGQVRRSYRPYGERLGQLAFHWNQLHEELSKLFAMIVTPKDINLGTSIWYSAVSDFQQREMLRVAAEKAGSLTEEQREAILYVLNQIDRVLRHDRNRAMHAPLVHHQTFVDGAVNLTVAADPHSNSPHARLLAGKDLLKEFKLYAQTAEVLWRYTVQIIFSLRGLQPLPGKPNTPRAHQKKSRKPAFRQNTPK